MAKRPVKSLNLNTEKLKELSADDAREIVGASAIENCGACPHGSANAAL